MQIYIARGGQHHGPYDLEAVKAGLGTGAFSPADLAWYEGAPNWAPLSTLPGLQVNAPGLTPPPVPVMPPPMPAPFVPPANPAVAPAYDPNATWARGGASGGRGTGSGGLFKLLPVRIGVGVVGLIVMGLGIRQIVGGSKSSGSSLSSSANATPAPDVRHFVSDRADYDGPLAEHYMDFHFDYPAALPMKKGAECFSSNDMVEVFREPSSPPLTVRRQPIYPERFSVGSFSVGNGPALATRLAQVGPGFASETESNQRRSGGSYRKVFDGMTKLGPYDVYDYRDEISLRDDSGKEVRFWSRWVMIAPPTGKDGILLKFAATSAAPGMQTVEDAFDKGELAAIANSFRLGH